MSVAKADLHDAIQAGLQTHPKFAPGTLTRWVVVAEMAFPDGSQGLLHLSGSADGFALKSWEKDGMLFSSLFKDPS